MTDVQASSAALLSARRVVVLTGAGASAESGIPTFHDAMTGLWEIYNTQAVVTAGAFPRHPTLVWGWHECRRAKVLRAQSNPGHRPIAALERLVPKVTVVTENVDHLREHAGSAAPIRFHGGLSQRRCFFCALPHILASRVPDEPEGGRRLDPPRCLYCGGLIRPGVVRFGEGLPDAVWKDARAVAGSCDLMLVVGTSGLVYPACSPAAGSPKLLASNGSKIVQNSPRQTELDVACAERLASEAGVIIPTLVAAAWPSRRFDVYQPRAKAFKIK